MAAELEFPPDFVINEKSAVLFNRDDDLAEDVFPVRPLKVYCKFIRTYAVLHVGCKSKVKVQLGLLFDLSARNYIAAVVNDPYTLLPGLYLKHLQGNTYKRQWPDRFFAVFEIQGIVRRYRTRSKAVVDLQFEFVRGFELYVLLEYGN